MKSITVSESDAELDRLVGDSQNERIVLLRNGKPSAVMIGIESYDAEDLELATSPEFWSLIESRRRGNVISLAEARSRLSQ
jgi:PHD/YefM family antitoxin component YafN of YafNO toxin-antitoxin module